MLPVVRDLTAKSPHTCSETNNVGVPEEVKCCWLLLWNFTASSQPKALRKLKSPGNTWPSSALTFQRRMRMNSACFQMKYSYLAKNCCSTNLAPYASGIILLTVFGTHVFDYLMLRLKTGCHQQKADSRIKASQAVLSLWRFTITDMVGIRVSKKPSLKKKI
jgi:hypothetical protein